MSSFHARRLALLGCGHVGGSLALALREAGRADETVGYDAGDGVAARAVELEICDRAEATAAAAVQGADVVIVAVPVRATASVIESALTAIGADALVTDVGSTKASVVRAADALLGNRFVGAHPMAGSERSGPEAARAALFRGRVVLVTPTKATDPRRREQVTAMWETAGARVWAVDPTKHDALVARVSHLPHAAAYALVNAVARRGVADLAGLAAGGFIDSTRIAATPPAIWVDIFRDNREHVLPLIDELVAELGALRKAIELDRGVDKLLARAVSAREAILGDT